MSRRFSLHRDVSNASASALTPSMSTGLPRCHRLRFRLRSATSFSPCPEMMTTWTRLNRRDQLGQRGQTFLRGARIRRQAHIQRTSPGWPIGPEHFHGGRTDPLPDERHGTRAPTSFACGFPRRRRRSIISVGVDFVPGRNTVKARSLPCFTATSIRPPWDWTTCFGTCRFRGHFSGGLKRSKKPTTDEIRVSYRSRCRRRSTRPHLIPRLLNSDPSAPTASVAFKTRLTTFDSIQRDLRQRPELFERIEPAPCSASNNRTRHDFIEVCLGELERFLVPQKAQSPDQPVDVSISQRILPECGSSKWTGRFCSIKFMEAAFFRSWTKTSAHGLKRLQFLRLQ